MLDEDWLWCKSLNLEELFLLEKYKIYDMWNCQLSENKLSRLLTCQLKISSLKTEEKWPLQKFIFSSIRIKWQKGKDLP